MPAFLFPVFALFRRRRRALRTQVIIGFGLVLLLVGVIGAVSLSQLDGLARRGNTVVSSDVPYANELFGVALAAKAAANDERGFLLAGDEKFTAEIVARFKTIDGHVEKARALARGRDATQLDLLESQLAVWRSALLNEFALYGTDAEGARALALGATRDIRKNFENTLGEMLAAENASLAASAKTFRETGRSARSLMLIGFVVVLLAAASGWLLLRSVRARLRPLVDALRDVAGGDLTGSVSDATGDEIGAMARALDTTIANTRTAIGTLASTAGTLAAASQELNIASRDMVSALDSADDQAHTASAAAVQVSDSVNAAASGAEELASSIREIASSASEGTAVVTGAVDLTVRARATMDGLATSSAQIGDVLRVITDVAGQTHLLALNATIEAARAGAAGKGFAVVAGEVKELAQETGQASGDIGRRIEAIQADARSALTAIAEIATVIGRVSETQMVIASAVEEQSMTTSSIGQSVTEAAMAAQEIARNLSAVASATTQTRSGATLSATAAEEVAEMATSLAELASRFRYATTAS